MSIASQGQDQPPAAGPSQAAQALATWARPSGWSGWWSERYARMFGQTFGLNPPFDAVVVGQLLAERPFLFPEALDAVASPAEPVDRNGNPLPWRYERSLVRDMIGTRGLVLGGIGLAIALWMILLTLFIQPQPAAPGAGNVGAPESPAVSDPAPSGPSIPQPQNGGLAAGSLEEQKSRRDVLRRKFEEGTARAVDILEPELNPKSVPPNAQQGPKSDAPSATAPTAAPERKVAPAIAQPPNSQSAPPNAQRDPKSDAPAAAAPTGARERKVAPAITQSPNLLRPPPDLPRPPPKPPNASGSPPASAK